MPDVITLDRSEIGTVIRACSHAERAIKTRMAHGRRRKNPPPGLMASDAMECADYLTLRNRLLQYAVAQGWVKGD